MRYHTDVQYFSMMKASQMDYFDSFEDLLGPIEYRNVINQTNWWDFVQTNKKLNLNAVIYIISFGWMLSVHVDKRFLYTAHVLKYDDDDSYLIQK